MSKQHYQTIESLTFAVYYHPVIFEKGLPNMLYI